MYWEIYFGDPRRWLSAWAAKQACSYSCFSSQDLGFKIHHPNLSSSQRSCSSYTNRLFSSQNSNYQSLVCSLSLCLMLIIYLLMSKFLIQISVKTWALLDHEQPSFEGASESPNALSCSPYIYIYSYPCQSLSGEHIQCCFMEIATLGCKANAYHV